MAVIIRILIGIVTVIITLAVIALLDREGHSEPHTACLGVEEREYLRALTLRGIDAGYQDQIEHLFSVWMKDSQEQPKRAINGTQTAISAHVRARSNALKWSPPEC